MKLLIATANVGKLVEIRGLLAAVVGLEVISLEAFPEVVMPPETGDTMQANARIKALHLVRSSGLKCLADDSGIEVHALGGAPGVRSARWVAGSDATRTQALLSALEAVPDGSRGARYRCAICVAWPAQDRAGRDAGLAWREVEATCEGRITRVPRGANGFGYDPIFEITEATGAPPQYIGQTMAEVPPEVKAAVSHRARAIAALLPTFEELGA